MRPETLRAIVDFWLPEFERHGTYRDAVKMVVGNKIDLVCAQGTLRRPGNVGPGLTVSRSARKWLLSCAWPHTASPRTVLHAGYPAASEPGSRGAGCARPWLPVLRDQRQVGLACAGVQWPARVALLAQQPCIILMLVQKRGWISSASYPRSCRKPSPHSL